MTCPKSELVQILALFCTLSSLSTSSSVGGGGVSHIVLASELLFTLHRLYSFAGDYSKHPKTECSVFSVFIYCSVVESFGF